jgi:hypothetical protein
VTVGADVTKRFELIVEDDEDDSNGEFIGRVTTGRGLILVNSEALRSKLAFLACRRDLFTRLGRGAAEARSIKKRRIKK